jgi:hypothetical protein
LCFYTLFPNSEPVNFKFRKGDRFQDPESWAVLWPFCAAVVAGRDC